MDFYQILEIPLSANEHEIRKSFLKLAKRYHPDVYKGVNKEHFKKVLEGYNILKNPTKRSDYDKHQRIKSMKSSKEYQDYEQKMRREGQEFSHEMYEEMKNQSQQEKTIRDKVDPEFEEAFKKLNLNRLYQEFLARPIRNQPDELHEQMMRPSHMQKMSRRDMARMKFVVEHRRSRLINNSVRNKIKAERENILDVQEGVAEAQKMNYKQLVEELNKDIKALNQIQSPVALYKEETETVAEIIKKQDIILDKTKKIVYPIWAVIIFVNSLLMIGYYYQEQTIMKNAAKIEIREKFSNYKYD